MIFCVSATTRSRPRRRETLRCSDSDRSTSGPLSHRLAVPAQPERGFGTTGGKDHRAPGRRDHGQKRPPGTGLVRPPGLGPQGSRAGKITRPRAAGTTGGKGPRAPGRFPEGRPVRVDSAGSERVRAPRRGRVPGNPPQPSEPRAPAGRVRAAPPGPARRRAPG